MKRHCALHTAQSIRVTGTARLTLCCRHHEGVDKRWEEQIESAQGVERLGPKRVNRGHCRYGKLLSAISCHRACPCK